jgi:hemerythrin-like domain-containing protein
MATLNQLRHDHANMVRLLHVLSLRHEALAQGERPDFHLIREVVDYILDYMKGFIEPLERLYSEHLLGEGGDAVSRRLSEDYQALNKRLNMLSETLDMILMDAVVPMERFADDFKAYLDAHSAYLRAEREELFPFFRDKLSKKEQQRLLQMLPPGTQENLARLKEDNPELHEEFRDAPPPFA